MGRRPKNKDDKWRAGTLQPCRDGPRAPPPGGADVPSKEEVPEPASLGLTPCASKADVRRAFSTLIREHGVAGSPLFAAGIDQLVDNYHLYLKASASIKKLGLVITEDGVVRLNPVNTVLNQARRSILALLKEYGMTPLSALQVQKDLAELQRLQTKAGPTDLMQILNDT